MKIIDPVAESNAFTPLFNFISGLLLKISNPFKKGDFIEIDGQLGSVKKRGLNQTIITNLDGSLTSIENGQFYKGDLHNLSTKNIIRLALGIELCYTTDMTRAKEAIHNFLAQNEKILDNPTPKLQVVKLEAKFVEISVQPWCLLDNYMELDNLLEQRLKDHMAGLGYEVKIEDASFENLSVTA